MSVKRICVERGPKRTARGHSRQRCLAALCLWVGGCTADQPEEDEHRQRDEPANDVATDRGEPPIADADAALPATTDLSPVQDFIITDIGYHYPEGLRESAAEIAHPCSTDGRLYRPLELDGLSVQGFDLDGRTSSDSEGLCGQPDLLGVDGTPGLDFAFLHMIDLIETARPGQGLDATLAGLPRSGNIRIGIRVSDLDDLRNDDHVEILVTNLLDPPLLGTDHQILPGGSVRADPDPAFQSRFVARVVDGVLEGGPSPLSIGPLDLHVIEDLSITLDDAMFRAVLRERPDGTLEADCLLAGWWALDDLRETTYKPSRALGASRDEMDCVLERYADHSSDGETCDAISMVFEGSTVGAVITGLDQAGDRASSP